MKKIYMSGKKDAGKYAIVDDDDYDRFILKKWYITSNYAVTHVQVDRKTKMVKMHRLVMNTPPNLTTHHKDHNKLNNQKNNLVNCTMGENSRHRLLSTRNTSGFIGVSKNRTKPGWKSTIWVNGESLHLGTFHDLTEAAVAYDQASIEFYGEFGVRNYL